MALPPDHTPPPPGPRAPGWYDGSPPPGDTGLPSGSFPAGYGVDIVPGGPGSTGPPSSGNPTPAGGDFYLRPAQPAPFFRRALAFVLDLAICDALASLLGGMAAFGTALAAHSPAVWEDAAAYAALVAAQAFPCIVFGYFLFFTGYGGRTPMKMVLSLEAQTADGETLSWPRALWRTVCYLAPVLTWGLGFLSALGPAKRGLHDRMSGTRVVYRPPHG